ncbi:hypothetical protein D3C71_498000 [compost metagenome]
MTPILLALALQSVSLADLQSEAERYGRVAAAVGYCSLVGYSTDPAALDALAEGFRVQAAADGMDADQVAKAIEAGVAKEIDEVRLQGNEADMAPAERKAQTIRTVNSIKARCNAFGTGEFRSVIGDLEKGDAGADAMLAEMLALIDDAG